MFWLKLLTCNNLSAFYSHEKFLWNSSTTYFFCSIRIWKIYSLLNCNEYPLLTKYCNSKKLCEKIFIYLIIINGMNLKLIHQFLVCCSQVGQDSGIQKLFCPCDPGSFCLFFLLCIYRKFFYFCILWCTGIFEGCVKGLH